jgi:hypothetical protein
MVGMNILMLADELDQCLQLAPWVLRLSLRVLRCPEGRCAAANEQPVPQPVVWKELYDALPPARG